MENDLNISQEIRQKSMLKKFNSKNKNYEKIMEALVAKIDKFLPYETFTVDKRFNLGVVASGKQGIYVGDDVGRVFHMVDSSFSSHIVSHNMKVTCLLYDPLREVLISACEEKTIQLTSARGYKAWKTIKGLSSVVRCMALSPSSNTLYTGDDEGCVKAYDLADGSCFLQLNTVPEPCSLRSMIIDEEDAVLYTGNSEGAIFVLEIETPLIISKLCFDTCSITSLVLYKPQNALFAATDTGRIDVWSTRTYGKINEIHRDKSPITKLLVLATTNVLLGSNEEGCVYMWDLADGGYMKNIRRFKKKGIRDLAASSDENVLYALGREPHVEVFDVESSKLLTRIYANDTFDQQEYIMTCTTETQLFTLSFSKNVLLYDFDAQYQTATLTDQFKIPSEWKVNVMVADNNNPLLYFGCKDGRVMAWDYKNKVETEEYSGHEGEITSINLRIDGAYLYVADSLGTTYVWKTSAKHRTIVIADENKTPVKFMYSTQDGRYLIVSKADGTMQLRSLDQETVIYEVKAKHGDEIMAHCQSGNLTAVFTATKEGKIQRWTVEDTTLVPLQIIYKEGLEISHMCCNSNGGSMYCYGDDQKLRVFDISFDFGQPALVRSLSNLLHLSISHDNSVLYMLDIEGNLQGMKLIPRMHANFFVNNSDVVQTSIAANADNIYVGNENGTIDVWSMTTEDLVLQLTARTAKVNCLLMNSMGSILYSGHEDGALALWNTSTNSFIREMRRQSAAITAMNFNSTETLLLTAGKDLRILIWDTKDLNVKHIIPISFEVEQLEMSLNDKHVMLRLVTGRIAVYALNGKNIGYIGEKDDKLNAIAPSKYGEKLYMAFEDAVIKIFDLSDMEPIGTLCSFNAPVEYIKVSRDGNKMFIITRNGVLSVLDINNAHVVAEIPLYEAFTCKAMVFNSDYGKLFAVGDSNLFLIDINERLNRYEKLYLQKTVSNVDTFAAERDFVSLLEFINPFYSNSFILKTYFNPILICALLNYQNAIQMIFTKQLTAYPQLNDANQLSPLILALKLKNYNIAQVILQSVMPNIQRFIFSYNEMKEIMKAKYNFTHKYLKDVMVHLRYFTDSKIKVPVLSQLDEDVRLEYDVNYFFTEQRFQNMTLPTEIYKNRTFFDVDTAVNKLKHNFKRRDAGVTIYRDVEKIQASEVTTLKSQVDPENDNPEQLQPKQSVVWRPTKLYRLNGYYSFEEGTTDSIQFLKNYVDSSSNEFILSNWRYIIDYKWQKVVQYLIPAAMLHFCHVGFYSAFIINPGIFWVMVVDIALLGALALYEILSLFITGIVHFNDLYNLIDFTLISSCSVVLAFTRHYEHGLGRQDIELLRYFQIATLLLVFFRGATYLRLFSFFRHLIEMIIGVTFNSMSLLFILGYALVAFAVMLAVADENYTFNSFLVHNLFSIHGELFDYTEEEEGITVLGWIIFYIMAVFIPLILVNFLIAKLSNKYEELKRNERVTSYKEKAKLILEIEFFYRFKNKGKESRNFTFIAKEASELQESEDLLEEKIEENLDTLHVKIEDIKKSQVRELQGVRDQHEEFKGRMNTILLENTDIKDNLVALKNDTKELKGAVDDRSKKQTTKMVDISSKVDELIGAAEQNKQLQEEQLKRIAELELELERRIKEAELAKQKKR